MNHLRLHSASFNYEFIHPRTAQRLQDSACLCSFVIALRFLVSGLYFLRRLLHASVVIAFFAVTSVNVEASVEAVSHGRQRFFGLAQLLHALHARRDAPDCGHHAWVLP